MNPFEKMVDELIARDDVSDGLIDALIAERIAFLQATIDVHEAEKRQLEAEGRLRNRAVLVERAIATADMIAFERSVRDDLDRL